MWQYTGQERPPFADEPGPGQESVWDYPRPPALVRSEKEVIVTAGDEVLARSSRCLRVLETASPPTWYIPEDDVNRALLVASPGSSFCEWKGAASYWALAARPGDDPVAWSYPEPGARFADLRNAYGFYPGRVDCFVDGERVRPQPGYFYGGWITDELTGPWKGDPGTGHW
jgi:uncharacterized protein (DUF427 family)